MKYLSCLALGLALVMSTEAVALAGEGAAPPAEGATPPAEETHWYGWQTLALDGAAVSLVAGSLLADDKSTARTGLMGASFAVYLLAAPIVHAVHGRYGAMGADLGVRVALPLVGGALGYALGAATVDRHPDKNIGSLFASVALPAIYAWWGAVVGGAGAIALDAAVIAKEPVQRPKDFAWMPTLTPRAGGATAGVAGTF